MTRPLSVLDGPYAFEWNRTLAKRPAAPIAERKQKLQLREHHVCPCGCKQELEPCGHWVCRAPGHPTHVCGGTP